VTETTYRCLLAAESRGGFWWTRKISRRLGILIAVPALRHGVHPSTISLTSLLVHLLASLLAISQLPDRPLAAGFAALLGWQFAYALDCCDGTVARASDAVSEAGARLDVTADYTAFVLTSMTLAYAAASAVRPATVLILVLGLMYTYQLFDEVVGRLSISAASTQRSRLYQMVGFVRDSGFQRAVAGAAILLGSSVSFWALAALGTLGGGLFLARLAMLYRLSRA
jgi:phosphatidylglycerophosphate synthase